MGRGLNPTEATNSKVKVVLANLRKGTSVVQACKNANINRSCLYDWKNYSEENSKQFYKVLDSRSIVVEDALYKDCMMEGNTVAKIFYLKNRVNDRWGDENTVNLKGNISYSNMTEDEIDEKLKKLGANIKDEYLLT